VHDLVLDFLFLPTEAVQAGCWHGLFDCQTSRWELGVVTEALCLSVRFGAWVLMCALVGDVVAVSMTTGVLVWR
jgi:hypothetical protein